MWGCVRHSRGAYLLAALLMLGAVTTAMAGPGPPRRVVSINLCTDRLALALAGPGQLHSVSHLSLDPRVSPVAKAARAHVINRGQAEEIFLMRPDLVLVSTFTRRSTVTMLRRLGLRVVEFSPAHTLDDVRRNIRRMGAVLGRQEAAARLLARFDARLAALRPPDDAPRPRAVIYQANGFVSGPGSLPGQILSAAGFTNAAAEAGYGAGQKMPLEVLALSAPDLVVIAQPYPGGSRAEAVLAHPVLRALTQEGRGARVTVPDQAWICGTPLVLDALERLTRARRALTGGAP